MESDRSYRIWELAHPLSAELCGRISTATSSIAITKTGEPISAIIELLRATTALFDRNNIINQQIVSDIRKGRLVAAGYRVAPTVSRGPVLISGKDIRVTDVICFPDKIGSELVRHERVRVIRCGLIPNALRTPRPNVKARNDDIVKLIGELYRNDRIVRSPLKSAVHVLQTEIKRLGMEVGGISPENLKRLIRSVIPSK